MCLCTELTLSASVALLRDPHGCVRARYLGPCAGNESAAGAAFIAARRRAAYQQVVLKAAASKAAGGGGGGGGDTNGGYGVILEAVSQQGPAAQAEVAAGVARPTGGTLAKQALQKPKPQPAPAPPPLSSSLPTTAAAATGAPAGVEHESPGGTVSNSKGPVSQPVQGPAGAAPAPGGLQHEPGTASTAAPPPLLLPHPSSLPEEPQLLHALALHHLRHARRAEAEQALAALEAVDGACCLLCWRAPQLLPRPVS